ncbi:hypothetical protein [Deinococcus soli (ex Cha et al. 2016)]|uniref:hypothetical protein n=1 Tax=Deinococcus soli (ex Cha et al. 2016) TaxID=1309411 RepID=UPI001E5ABB7B
MVIVPASARLSSSRVASSRVRAGPARIMRGHSCAITVSVNATQPSRIRASGGQTWGVARPTSRPTTSPISRRRAA